MQRLCFLTILMCILQYALGSPILKSVEYTARITQGLVYVSVRNIIQNDGEHPMEFILITVPKEDSDNLSQIYAISKSKERFNVERLNNITIPSQPETSDKFTFFKVPFSVKLQESLEFTYEYAMGRRLVPKPETSESTTKHLVSFKTLNRIPTAYVCDKQTVSFSLPPGTFLSSDQPVKAKSVGHYALVEQIANTSISTMHLAKHVTIYLMMNKPLPRIAKLGRHIEISHWGNNHVHEYSVLTNDAALFTGEFDRVASKINRIRNLHTTELFEIDAYLPEHVSVVSYYDESGNISTSKFTKQDHNALLTIQPRYALCGGWKADWHLEYKLPSDKIIHKLMNSSSYEVSIPLGPGYANIFVEDFDFQVTLPPAANIHKVIFPRELPNPTINKHWGAGDIFSPRPSIVLHIDKFSQTLKDINNHDIKIIYTLDESVGVKPIQYSIVVFCILLLIILLHRLQWVQIIRTKVDLDVIEKALKQSLEEVSILMKQSPNDFSETGNDMKTSPAVWKAISSQKKLVEGMLRKLNPVFHHLCGSEGKNMSQLNHLVEKCSVHVIGYNNIKREEGFKGLSLVKQLLEAGLQAVQDMNGLQKSEKTD